MVNECIVPVEGGGALTELCGISVLERLLRTLQRCGIKKVTILSTAPELFADYGSKPPWPRAELTVTVRKTPGEQVTTADIINASPDNIRFLLVVRGDTIFDPRLLRLILNQKNNAALVDSDVPQEIAPLVVSAPDTSRGKFCGAALMERGWCASQSGPFEKALLNGFERGEIVALDVADQPRYDVELRRTLRPFWFLAPPATNNALAERLLLNATQKGALDIPARVHGPIERFLISRLCRTAITPNQLTIFSNIVAWTATIFFATGHVAAGILIALVVGVLDGLDGRQARAKIETTKRGKLEHWFDAIFEWSWWTALAYHFQISGQLAGAFKYWFLLLAAEGLDLAAKGIVYFRTGRTIDELNAFERIVRLVGGRRNVYVWILAIGALLGAPEKAFVAMAWLEVATAVVHLPDAIRTLCRRRN